MRVLVLHSRYRSGVVSGENRVVDDEVELLRNAGHEVVVWQPELEQRTSGLQAGVDVVWSRSAAARVRALVAESEPDIVHVHSLYPRLSPTVLRSLGPVPVAMTLHNFRAMCLAATYLREGSTCEVCAGRIPWRGVVHACYRNSNPASAALGVSLVLHRALGSFERVDRYFAVSDFIRQKHVDAGLSSDKVRVKSNFAWPHPRREGAGGSVLFLGRISREKGLRTVLAALPPSLELVVAGDGPERSLLEAEGHASVRFLGPVDPSRVVDLVAGARAVVVPSVWYEGQPRVIIEAFAAGVPVLASRIGGLPELVDHDRNGFLIDPSDVREWRAALEEVTQDAVSRRLGAGAFSVWEQRFSPEIALRELEAAYDETISLAATTVTRSRR